MWVRLALRKAGRIAWDAELLREVGVGTVVCTVAVATMAILVTDGALLLEPAPRLC